MKGIQVTADNLKGARLYVKKPIPIQAIQITQTFWVASLEGNHQGKENDYLLRGVRGELYICDRVIFEETYTIPSLPPKGE